MFGSASSSSHFGGSTQALGAAPISPFGASSTPLMPFLQGTTLQSPGLFGSASSSPFGQTQASPFGQPQHQPSPFGQTHTFPSGQPQQQPSSFGRIQAIIDAYKDDPENPKYAFKHLLLSVTDPSTRGKPAGVSDVMWAKAINKLEGMDSAERERLWPELVQGFKDLSKRLKMQDDVLAADAQRLQTTEMNVKLLQRHFEVETVPWIQKLRQKEQELQRKLLKMMRIVEGLEDKGFRMPLTKGEAELSVRLRNLSLQLQGSRAELPRRVDALLSSSRLQETACGICHTDILGNGKIEEESFIEMHKLLGQQTEAIARLVTVLKRDIRDGEIVEVENQNRDVKLKEGLGQSKISMNYVTF